MKLVRYGAPGAEKPGLRDGETLRDLSAHVDDITGAMLGDASLDALPLPGVQNVVLSVMFAIIFTFEALYYQFSVPHDYNLEIEATHSSISMVTGCAG